MKKVCQSCGMPLIEGQLDRRGTETDGKRSEVYCNLCYLNGSFQEPNITMDEMLERGLKGIDESSNNKFKKWMIKKTYPMMLKNLGRWK